jgi:hypothetical protein
MIILGQATVPSSSTVSVFTIPAGTVSTVIFQPPWVSAQAVYIGTSPGVSATNGLLVPVTPTNLDGYLSVTQAKIYATTGNATASSFSYIISTGA